MPAREPLEQVRSELRRNALAAILDCEPEMPVALLRHHPDRRLAVPNRVCNQVSDDSLERLGVGPRLELGRYVDLDRTRALRRVGEDELLDGPPDDETLRPNLDRPRLQAREVKQLLDQPVEALAVLVQRVAELGQLLLRELVTAKVEGRADPVNDGGGCAQLVGGEGDEVALHAVDAQLLLVYERTLKEGGGQDADRRQAGAGGLVEVERRAAAIGAEEAQTAALAHERQRHEPAGTELVGDLERDRAFAPDVSRDDGFASLQRLAHERPVLDAQRESAHCFERHAVRGDPLDFFGLG